MLSNKNYYYSTMDIEIEQLEELKEADLFFDEQWIKEAINEEKSYSRFYKIPVQKITCYSLFIDISKNVIKLNRQYIKLDNLNTLNQSQIINIINNDTNNQFKNFRIEHILNFNLDLEPVLVNDFIHNYDNNKIKKLFLKEISYTSDISLNDTINYFHPLNCLIFIYKQKININSKKKYKNINKSKKIFDFKIHNNKTRKRL